MPSDTHVDKHATSATRKDAKFWLIFFSICASTFVSALDLTGLSTALPTVVLDLRGSDFVWIGSGDALAATALQPLCGGLAAVCQLLIGSLTSKFSLTLCE